MSVFIQNNFQFLDGSHIKELCMYLEVLHTKGKANSHHTTILLNCYTRLAAHDKIRDFIDRDFECNVETAVQVSFETLKLKFKTDCVVYILQYLK